MFRNLKDDLLDVLRNQDKMSFEEHVKNTCIEKLDACINYSSIPSVERKIERELEKEKREKLNKENNLIDEKKVKDSEDSTENMIQQTQTIRIMNDEL